MTSHVAGMGGTRISLILLSLEAVLTCSWPITRHYTEPTDTQNSATTARSVPFCLDYKQKRILDGESFIPNEVDPCTECVCLDGEAQMCVASVCSLPHDCRDVRRLLTDQCCKYVCFDKKWRNLNFGFPRNYSGDLVGTRFRDTYSVPYTSLSDPHRTGDDVKDEDSHPSTYTLRLGFTTMTTVLILICLMFSIHRLRIRRLRALIAHQSMMESHPYGHDSYDEVDGSSRLCHSDFDSVGNTFSRSDPPPPPYKHSPSVDLPPAYDDVIVSLLPTNSNNNINNINDNNINNSNNVNNINNIDGNIVTTSQIAGGSCPPDSTIVTTQEHLKNLRTSAKTPPPESV